MGWLFKSEMTQKNQLVQELVKSSDSRRYRGSNNDDSRYYLTKCISYSLRGNILWSVMERTTFNSANDSEIETKRFICCDILSYSKEHRCWGYKDLQESMGPAYYSCPLSYLKKVPVADGEYAVAWREGVENYHARKKSIRKIEVGNKVRLVDGYPQEEVVITSLKPLAGRIGLKEYRITKRMIDNIIS